VYDFFIILSFSFNIFSIGVLYSVLYELTYDFFKFILVLSYHTPYRMEFYFIFLYLWRNVIDIFLP
jgi:hypothetical protein